MLPLSWCHGPGRLQFVFRLFGAYKEIPHPFWGFVLDIDDLETKLMVYLEERAKNAKTSSKPTKPVSASWLAILFSVMAVGSQYHDSPYHIRTRDSQKYIQISFHFLRLGNFLLRCGPPFACHRPTLCVLTKQTQSGFHPGVDDDRLCLA